MKTLINIKGTIETPLKEKGTWLSNFKKWLERRDENFNGDIKIFEKDENNK